MATSDATIRSRINSIATALLKDGRGLILLSVSLGWFMAVGVRITIPALIPEMMTEFRFDYTIAGFMLSGMWIAYAIMQFPGGVIADIIGEQRIILVSTAFAMISVVVMVIAPTFGLFLLGTICIGVGTGLFGTSRITILSNVYPDADSTAISFSQASGNFGNMVLPVGAGIVSAYFGWRLGIGYLIPVFLLAILCIWRFVPRRTSSQMTLTTGNHRDVMSNIGRAVMVESVVLATILLCCLLFLFQGLTGFLPAYLVEMKGLTTTGAATIFGFFFLSAIIFQFVSGVVSDLYGARRTIIVFSLLALPAYLLFPRVESLGGILFVVFFLAGALGALPPAHTYTVRRLPEVVQGTGYGLIRTVYMAVGAMAPPIIGYLADSGRFDTAFPMLGAVVLGAGLVSLVLILRE